MKVVDETFLKRKTFGVVDVIVHEDYKKHNGFKHDIALLKLAKKVDQDTNVNTVLYSTVNCTVNGSQCLHSTV